MEEIKENIEEVKEISCWNDVLFKHLLVKQPELIYVLAKGVTEQPIENLTIHNSEIIPLFAGERKGGVDLFTKDEKANIYDFEMQNGSITEAEILRFMYYSCYLYLAQSLSGQDLIVAVKHIYCIILAQDGIPYDGLIRHDIMNVNSDVLPGIRQHLITINMPHIIEVAKEKGLPQLNSFERIIYALHTNIDSDILKLDDRMVNEMNANKIAFFFSGKPEARLALKRELLIAEEKLKLEMEKQQEEKWANREKEMKIKEEQMKVQEEQMKVQEEQMKVQEEQMKVQEEQMKVQEEQMKVQEEQMKVQEEQMKVQEEQMKVQEEQMKAQEEKMKIKEEQISAQKSQIDSLVDEKEIAIENIMKTFNVSHSTALSLFNR